MHRNLHSFPTRRSSDLAMMRAVAGSHVLYPSDAVCAEKLLEQMAKNRGIFFLRTSRPKTPVIDRKSTRLNSIHGYISYAVFCLKKKNNHMLFNNKSLIL